MSSSAALARVEALLRTIEVDAPPLAERLLPAMRELFGGTMASLMRPTRDEHGWSLEFCHFDGMGEAERKTMHDFVSSPDWSWTPFFPPTPALENAVIRPVQTARLSGIWDGNPAAATYEKVGIVDDMGTIVCEGPVLLAYLGLGRDREPFSDDEEALFRRLQPLLQRRIFFEHRLRRMHALEQAFEAAFELIPAPAFLVAGRGRVEHANQMGRELLARDREGVAAELAATVTTTPDTDRFRAVPVDGAGSRGLHLAIRRTDRPELALRLAEGRARWQLTSRQLEVLELLAWGESNKGIAAQLACAEATVEIHVTALLRKAEVPSRAALVARFWTGAA